MNYNRAALKWYSISLLVWLVLSVIPLAIGLFDDVTKFLGNKFKLKKDEQTASLDKSLIRSEKPTGAEP